jgi:hypothetical protein
MNDESLFTVEGNEWQQQSFYGFEGHPAIEGVKFIRNTKFPARVFCGWMSVSMV